MGLQFNSKSELGKRALELTERLTITEVPAFIADLSPEDQGMWLGFVRMMAPTLRRVGTDEQELSELFATYCLRRHRTDPVISGLIERSDQENFCRMSNGKEREMPSAVSDIIAEGRSLLSEEVAR